MTTKADLRTDLMALLVMEGQKGQQLEKDLEAAGLALLRACNCREAKRILGAAPSVQVVLTDVALPDGCWCDVLKDVHESESTAAIVVCARRHSVWLQNEVVRRGAFYLEVAPYRRLAAQLLVQAAASRPKPGVAA